MNPSGPPPGPRVRTLWVRGPYLAHILAGRKTVEVRVGYDNIRRLRPGDLLRLNDRHLAVIRRVGRYAGFEELLAREDPAAIAPDLPPGELLDALRRIYPPEKEALGAVALELALRPYDAVLFDMGYTLVGFEPPQEVIVQEVLRSLGADRSADEILAAARDVWGAYWDDAGTATFAGCNKPHPAIFHQALEQMGLDAGRVLYIGDSYRHDVVGARNAGIEPVLVDRGGEAAGTGCTVIADLRGVLELVA
jgi:ASC-1-like (ASCH) protein